MNIEQLINLWSVKWPARWSKHNFVLISFCMAFTLAGCKQHYRDTVKLPNGLYVEWYSTSGIGSLSEDYLTDSTTFRIDIGTFDEENDWYYYRCSGDSIIIQKMDDSQRSAKAKVVDEKIYLLSQLKSIRNYKK